MESARSRKYPARPRASASYQTVRPFFWLDNSPARAIVAKCLATIEKSIEQHSATSVTEQGLPHLSRHDSRRARVGSASALSMSGSRSRSRRARLRAACFGEGAKNWFADAMTQVLTCHPKLSNLSRTPAVRFGGETPGSKVATATRSRPNGSPRLESACHPPSPTIPAPWTGRVAFGRALNVRDWGLPIVSQDQQLVTPQPAAAEVIVLTDHREDSAPHVQKAPRRRVALGLLLRPPPRLEPSHLMEDRIKAEHVISRPAFFGDILWPVRQSRVRKPGSRELLTQRVGMLEMESVHAEIHPGRFARTALSRSSMIGPNLRTL